MESGTPVRCNKKQVVKRVCKNLSKAFGESAQIFSCLKPSTFSEIVKLKRKRLMSQIHRLPHPFFGKQETSTVKLFTCETGDGIPNLRKQLQAYAARRNSPTKVFGTSKYLRKKFIDAFPPYNFTRFKSNPDSEFQIIEMSSGRYYHFGIRRYLKRPEPLASTVSINVGFYVMFSLSLGLPRLKKFIIIGKQPGSVESFVIGVYCGVFPIEIIANEVLQPLVAEISSLKNEGISIGNSTYRFLLSSIICDPVAYSLATCTSLPDSMYGCSKCKSEANYIYQNDTTRFPIVSSDLRDDEDFKFCVASEHHLIPPVIAEIEIGLISQVSIDYKHFVCFGVMKTMVSLWTSGEVKVRLNRALIQTINQELVDLTASCPSDFKSKPKPMDIYSSWTAYDFRQFLLYYGPIVLRGKLSHDIYVNFLHLNMAMRIGLDTRHSDIDYFLIGHLLRSFVKGFAGIYGYDKVDYNVHNLLHLESVARRYQNLDNVGGFQFDDNLQTAERILKEMDCSGDCLLNAAKIISVNNERALSTKSIGYGTFISTKEPNNYYLVSNEVVKIKSMEVGSSGEIILSGQRFLKSLPLTAVQNSSQNILIIDKLSDFEQFTIDKIICKAVVLPNRRKLYAMSLLNF